VSSQSFLSAFDEALADDSTADTRETRIGGVLQVRKVAKPLFSRSRDLSALVRASRCVLLLAVTITCHISGGS
jgi:hypothetical protein